MADLTGMFAQLNKAVQGNPLATGQGQGLLDIASQGAGNVLSNMPGQSDPYSYMNQGAKQLQGQQDMGQLDLQTPEGLAKASEIAGKMGDVQKQAMFAAKSRELSMELEAKAKAEAEAQQAKNNAILDAGNAEIQENLAKTQARQQKAAALGMAKRDGNQDIVEGLKSGLYSPEAYMQTKLDKEKLYELSKGEMLTDSKGNVIRINPDVTAGGSGGGGNFAAEVKIWNDLTTKGNEGLTYSSKLEGIMNDLANTNNYDAGLYASVEDFILTQLGQRGNEEYLRTRIKGVVNHEAIGMLPPGPASDRDVAIVREGVPQGNAGKEEIMRFLEANARVAKRTAEYDKMKADYVIRKDAANFQKAWDTKMASEAKKEWAEATPSGAVQAVMADPSLKDAFLAKYHWLPEGI